MLRATFAGVLLAFCGVAVHARAQEAPAAQAPAGARARVPASAHVWELQEIELRAAQPYANAYVEVETWIELKGPGFSKRIYGFWDGGDVFRVRFVATAPGQWSWTSASNQPADAGLNGKSGGFTARQWSEAEKLGNANRRGFLRSTPNARPVSSRRRRRADSAVVPECALLRFLKRLQRAGMVGRRSVARRRPPAVGSGQPPSQGVQCPRTVAPMRAAPHPAQPQRPPP